MTEPPPADNDNAVFTEVDLAQLPDVRDGLTRLQRAILYVLHQSKADFGDRRVPTATIYGRVVEYVNVSVDEFQRELARMTGRGGLS